MAAERKNKMNLTDREMELIKYALNERMRSNTRWLESLAKIGITSRDEISQKYETETKEIEQLLKKLIESN